MTSSSHSAIRKVVQMKDPSDEDNGTASTPEKYMLQLFINGATLRSHNAITNIKAIGENELAGNYELEVVDIHQKPELAAQIELIALPTLIKNFPLPMRRLIGDLSDKKKVLAILDINTQSETGQRS